MGASRFAAALALSLCALPALAQDDPSNSHWHMVQINRFSLMAADTHGAQDLGNGIKRVSASMYFATPNAQETETPIDFILMEEEFDCSSPGRYRMLKADGYQANVREPVSSSYPKAPEWETVGRETDGFGVWKAVCNQPAPDTSLARFTTHEGVLAHYREFLKRYN